MARICKVLIVENDHDVRDLLANVVEDEGYFFATVETGREMRGALDEDDYDIAIIDVTQPGPDDGFALARLARELGCGVVLITGDHFLLKPFGVKQLTALADKILTEITAHCVRRKRSDESFFAPELEG